MPRNTSPTLHPAAVQLLEIVRLSPIAEETILLNAGYDKKTFNRMRAGAETKLNTLTNIGASLGYDLRLVPKAGYGDVVKSVAKVLGVEVKIK